jgi:hypothetical protein
MSRHVTLLRNAAVAMIAVAAFSLPMLSVAHADQQTDLTLHPKSPAAKTYHPQHRASTIRPKVYNAEPPGCTWPYQNQFPPCQSTWPAGSPSYHGSRPGVTFQDEH